MRAGYTPRRDWDINANNRMGDGTAAAAS